MESSFVPQTEAADTQHQVAVAPDPHQPQPHELPHHDATAAPSEANDPTHVPDPVAMYRDTATAEADALRPEHSQTTITAPPDNPPPSGILAPPPTPVVTAASPEQQQDESQIYQQLHHHEHHPTEHENLQHYVNQGVEHAQDTSMPPELAGIHDTNAQYDVASTMVMAAANPPATTQQSLEYAAAAVANMQMAPGTQEYVTAQEEAAAHDAAKEYQQNHDAGLGVITAQSPMASVPNGMGGPDIHTEPTPTIDTMVNQAVNDEINKTHEDPVNFAAIQEAAAMVIEEEASKKRKADALETGMDPAITSLKDPPPGAVPPMASASPSPPQTKRRVPPARISWDDRIVQLQEYKNEHGDLLIPIRYKKNPSLGKFVHNTREQYKLYHKQTPAGYKKKCSLTADRIQQLDDIGFVWSTQRSKLQEADWMARFEQLERYKAQHGDCLVPHGYEEDPSFAEWIHRQRTSYASMMKNSKPNPVVKERMDKLKAVGFNFTVHTDKWMDHWKQLKAYRDLTGNCQVPTHYSENPKLGRWVHTQRHQRRLQMKGKKSCMNEERIAMLDQLGFSWEVKPCLDRPRATWQQRMDELSQFYEKHRHFLINPQELPHLHQWCSEQRQRLRIIEKNDGKDMSKRMGDDRVAALAAIGFTKDTELADLTSHPGQQEYHHALEGTMASQFVHLDPSAAAVAAATAATAADAGTGMHMTVPNPAPQMVQMYTQTGMVALPPAQHMAHPHAHVHTHTHMAPPTEITVPTPVHIHMPAPAPLVHNPVPAPAPLPEHTASAVQTEEEMIHQATQEQVDLMPAPVHVNEMNNVQGQEDHHQGERPHAHDLAFL